MRKNKPILLVIAIAILFVSSISIWAASNDITQAEEGYFVKEFSADDFATYRGEAGNTEPRLGKTGVSEHDYLFAGWYKDQDCTKPYTSSAKTAVDNVAFAKFVSADVMRVKCMVTEGTHAGSDTTNLRMISTVDSRFYSEMGFNVTINDRTISCVEYTGYARISDTEEGLQVGYSPIAFSDQAEYFFTHRITGITSTYFDTFFYIQPYWVTTDGTMVQGVQRCMKVSDSYNKVLNLPIHLDSDTRLGAGEYEVSVSYDATKFTFKDDSELGDVFDVIGYSDDGNGTITIKATADEETVLDGMLGNLRLQLKDNQLINSKTEFTVAKNDLDINDLIYKNYATDYDNGQPDTSWYVGFENNKEFVISSMADLQGLATLVNAGEDFEGKTIILGADVIGYPTSVISNGVVVEGQTPTSMLTIGNSSNSFNGTFDGGNNTISGLYYSTTAASEYTGLFGQCGSDSLISNLKISNSYYTSNQHRMGAVAGVSTGSFENICVEDVALKDSTGKRAYIGGIVGDCGASAEERYVKECSFAGTIEASHYIGGIVGYVGKGSITIENCIACGTIKNGSSGQTGGIIGRIHHSTENPNEYVIRNCISTATVDTATTESVGCVFGRLDGDVQFTIENVYYTTDSETLKAYGTNSENVKYVAMTGSPQKLDDLTGKSAYKYTNLDFTSNNPVWAVSEGAYPQLSNFAEGTIIRDFSDVQRTTKGWYYNSFKYDEEGTQTEDTFTVKTVDDMFGLADLVNNDKHYFTNEIVQMDQDIVFNNVTGGEAAQWVNGTNSPKISWTPIGNSTDQFNGTFDGKGNEISGLYLSAEVAYTGLFGYCDDGSLIKNVKISNSFYKSNQHRLGAVSGVSEGCIENVYVAEDVTLSNASKSYVGGIIGEWEANEKECHIKQCAFYGTIDAKTFVGGIVGRMLKGPKTIKNCIASGTINNSAKNGEQVGGIVGRIQHSNNNDNAYKIINSFSDTTIAATDTTSVGMILGFTTASPIVTIENVYYTTGSETLGAYGTDSVKTTNATVTGEPRKLTDLTGEKAYLYTNLDFTSENPVWTAVKGQNPQLSTFAIGTPITDYEEYKYQRNDIDWYYNAVTYDAEGARNANLTYTLKDEDDMYGFARLVNTDGKTFAGEFIQLGNDIVFNNAVNGDEAQTWKQEAEAGKVETDVSGVKRVWKPIGTSSSKNFQGTFNGNENTISGIYLYWPSTNTGLFGYTINSTIQDLKLKNCYYQCDSTGNARMGSLVGYGDGTFSDIYCDVILKSTGYQNGGIIGYLQRYNSNDNTVLNMTNCWFDGEIYVSPEEGTASLYSGGIAGYAAFGSMDIGTCLYTGELVADTTVAGKTEFVGGLFGRISSNLNNKSTVTNTLSAGSVTIISNSDVSYVGKVAGRDQASTVNTNVSVTTIVTLIQGETSTDYSNVGTTGVQEVNASSLTGKLAHVMTNLQFIAETEGQNIWAARPSTYPIPMALADEDEIIPITDSTEKIDTDFATEEVDGITVTKISTIGELYGLAQLSQADSFAGTYFQLTTDLDLNPGENADDWYNNGTEATLPWIQTIGNADYPFAGTFDGAGHTIKGLYMKTDEQTLLGLFAKATESANIKDLRVTNSYLQSDTNVNDCMVGGIVAATDGATLGGLYSDAILVVNSQKRTYAGGIVGYADVSGDNILKIQNSWFTGDIYAYRFTGGILGALRTGEATFENCLYDGNITCSFDSGEVYLGGMCGIAYKTSNTTVLNLTSCISVGNIYDSSKENGVGMLVGVLQGDDTATSKLVINNVFAARDVVSTHAEVKGTATVEGEVAWTNHNDRLMGYCAQPIVSGATPNLSPSEWTMRVSGAPIPSSLINVLEDTDIVNVNNLDAELALTTIGANVHLADAFNTGLGNYNLTVNNVEASTITAYRQVLETLGFAEVYQNGVTEDENGVATYEVYNGSFVKNEGNWLLHVIYSQANKTLNITISTEGREALSNRLDADNVQTSEEDNDSVTLAMLSLTGSYQTQFGYYYGSSFVFSLPEKGHYIVVDGGAKTDLDALLKYLNNETADDGNIYIEAWIVSHQHGDHFRVLDSVYDEPSKIANIYVEAFYLNEPNRVSFDVDLNVASNMERRAMKLFKTEPNGECAQVYRMSTGQKYYFEGLTMDVILTHDVLKQSEVTEGNITSAIVLFTTDAGEKIFIGGDADTINMQYIIEMYGTDASGGTSSELLKGIDIFVASHHGMHNDAAIAKYLTITGEKFKYILYSASGTNILYYWKQEVDGYADKSCYYDEGHVIIDLSTMEATVESTTTE